MEKPKYLTYNKIRENENNDEALHKARCYIIDAIREKQMDDAYFPINAGDVTSQRLFKNYVLTERKIDFLEKYDSIFELNMSSNRDSMIAKAVRN